MNRFFLALPLLLAGILLIAPDAQASLLSKLARAGEKAGKLSAEAGEHGIKALVDAAASLNKSGLPDARALSIEDNQLLAVTADGHQLTVAARTDRVSAWRWTDEGLALFRQVPMVVSEADLPELGALLTQGIRGSGQTARILYADGHLGRLVLRTTAGGELLLGERYPQVFTPALHGSATSDLLAESSRQVPARILSLLDESDSSLTAPLKTAVGPNMLDNDDPAGAIAQLARTTVLVLGHAQGPRFVRHDASGQVRDAIDFATLSKSATAHDVNLILLDVPSPPTGADATGIDSTAIAGKLGKSLRDATTQASLGDMLSSIAGGSGDIFVGSARADQTQASASSLDATDPQAQTSTSRLRLAQVDGLSAARNRELSKRLIPLIPSWIQLPYLAGLVLLLVAARSFWPHWRSLRKAAPGFRAAPGKRLLVELVRGLGFVTLMPLSSLITAIALFGIYAAAIAAMVKYVGFSGIIAIIYGVRWYRLHREQVAEELRLMRFLAVPLAVLVVAIPDGALALALQAVHWDADAQPGLAAGIIRMALNGVIGLATCHYGLRWIKARHPDLAPARFFRHLISAPILGIEFVAGRIIGAGHGAGHGA